MTLEELSSALVKILEVHPEASKAIIHTNATHKNEVVRSIAYSTKHKPPRIIMSYK
jgi:predicted nuclease with RNAse H fold